MATIGSIEPFDPSTGDWSSYAARLDQYIAANDVPEGRKVATLLTVIGSATYKLLENLLTPDQPATKSYDELIAALKGHLSPKPLVIAERYRFHKRDQRSGETIAQYTAELRRLARYCEFGAHLKDALRDRLVCGLLNPAICKKLLAEDSLTLDNAEKIALAMETASKDASELNKHSQSAIGASASSAHAPVHHLQRSQKSNPSKPLTASASRSAPSDSRDECYRCGRRGHRASACLCIDMECHNCGKKGHIARACRQKTSKPAPKARFSPRPAPKDAKSRSAKTTHAIEEDDEYALHNVGTNQRHSEKPRNDPIWVHPTLNGTSIPMELDTGSALSILPLRVYNEHFASTELQPTSTVLKPYSGHRLYPKGVLRVRVAYNNQHVEGNVYVVETDGPALFGRDWLRSIRLDWHRLHHVCEAAPKLPSTTLQRLDALRSRYAAVFGSDRGRLNCAEGHLDLRDDASPKFVKARPLPYALRDRVASELDRLERDGIITKVTWSDWATPIVPVIKKDGSVRLCGDFKVSVNPQLKVDQYPLPKIDDIFASLAGGKHFSKIDLRQAYLQMEMDDESKSLLTLNTHKGLYRLNRLAFGVASAPAMWQCVMDQLLQGIPHVQCIIDDIIVTGETDDEHLANLEAVLQRLLDAGLRAHPTKTRFFDAKTEYCGHEVSAAGLHKLQSKVDAIQKAPRPTTVAELRSFLGLVSYYRKFIPNVATTLHPLNALLQRGQRWKWTPDCERAFQTIKQQMASDTILTHFNSDLPIRVASDASPYGLGAVLSHVMPSGEERPIAFASRTLSPAERNYSQIDKEALGIVWSLRKFHSYVYGRHFTLVTDHQPLTAIFHPSKHLPTMTASRLQRYAMFLAGHQYTIVYRKTADHGNADGLSRLPVPSTLDQDDDDDAVNAFHLAQFEPLPVTAEQVRRETRRDPTLAAVYQAVQTGDFSSCTDYQPYYHRRSELTSHQGCLLWGARVVIPPSLQHQVLEELHSSHCGIVRTKELARSYVWWPRIDNDIELCVSSCSNCQQHRHQPAKAPLHPWEWPARPWQRIHIDFAGPFLSSMWLIVVDAHSKWPEVMRMSSTTTEKTIEHLRTLFAHHGVPEQLVSDNGPQFTSDEFSHFLQSNGTLHLRTAPYHPATNGLAERFVQTFKSAMQTGNANLSIHARLQNFLLTYRNTPHATTKASPAQLLLQRSLRTRLDLIRPSTRSVVQQQQRAQAGNTLFQPARDLPVGSTAMVRDYRPDHPRWISGRVASKEGRHYQMEVYPGTHWRRHIDQVRSSAAPQQPVDLSADLVQASPPPVPAPQPGQGGGKTDEKITVKSESQPCATATTVLPAAIPRRYPTRIRKSPERLNL